MVDIYIYICVCVCYERCPLVILEDVCLRELKPQNTTGDASDAGMCMDRCQGTRVTSARYMAGIKWVVDFQGMLRFQLPVVMFLQEYHAIDSKS